MDQWFYIHQGRTYGPVSGDQLHSLAASGGLAPPDPIWRQDIPPGEAAPAGSVLVFFLSGGKATPPLAYPPSAPTPEWLHDLIDGREAASPAASAPPPDWLRDVGGAEEGSHPLKRKTPPS